MGKKQSSEQRYKKYCNYAPIPEENFLKRTHFEVLMPHQSVIMPPIYTFMKVKYVKSALTSQGGKKNQGTLIRKQHLGLKIEEGIPES